MNITRIEYFLMTAKYMSFTKAAAQLYITQPSLSKQIAILEEELGQKLFERSKEYSPDVCGKADVCGV
jgi:DNA-binding transcriptional LysR family regulator